MLSRLPPVILILTFVSLGLLGQGCSGTEPSGVQSSKPHEDTASDSDTGHEAETGDDTNDSDTTEQSEPEQEPEQEQLPCDEAPDVDADPSCAEICGRIDECFTATGPGSNADIIAECTARCRQNRRCANANGCSPEFDAMGMCFMDEPLDAICDGIAMTVGGCDEKLAILEACGAYFF